MSAVATQPEAPQADFLGVFDSDAAGRHAAVELKLHRESLMCCWRWEGPEVGGFIEVHTPLVKSEAGKTVYAYMEQCRVTKIEGRTVTAVLEGNDYSQNKDGTVLVLDMLEVWAPTRFLNLQK